MYWINKPYVRPGASNLATPVYVPNETYSFYINSDVIISDESFLNGVFGSNHLFLINGAGAQIADLGGLTIVSLVPFPYTLPLDIYTSFVLPVIPEGLYFFQIYNEALEREVLRSNPVLVSFNPFDTTSKIKFRHNDQLYGFRYDLLPDFYQELRLPVNQVKPVSFESTRNEYRESSNGRNLRRSKSFRDMKIELEFYFGTDEDQQALSAILEHDEVYIDGFRIINTKQIETAEKHFASTLSKSTFEILLDEYAETFDATSPTFGNGILFGGNSLYLPQNIIYSGT